MGVALAPPGTGESQAIQYIIERSQISGKNVSRME